MPLHPRSLAAAEPAPVARARRLAHGGRLTAAERLLAARLARQPDEPATLDALGDLYLASGHPTQAAEVFARLARQRPEEPGVLYRMAIALQRSYRYGDAVPVFHRLTKVTPLDPHAWTGLAWCLSANGAPAMGSVAARQAERLAPDDPRVVHTVAACCLTGGDLAGAAARYRHLLAADAADEAAAWGLALVAFRQGDFAAAWPYAECRHREMRHRGTFRPLAVPPWRGENLGGATVLIQHEQGAGDLLQFARFFPLAAARGVHLVVEAPASLREIIARVPGVADVVSPGAPVPDVRAALHLMSLPLVLGTGGDLLGTAVPYLTTGGPCPAPVSEILQTAAVADVPPGTVAGRRVGVVWAGAAGHANDHLRSMPLESLAPLLAVDGVRWVSLQAGTKAGDLARLPSSLRHRVVDASACLTSYEATAHLIAGLDLVVSVDTSVAHLAGAMGRPTWLLLPHVADWRWTGHGTTTDWYPGMRLFRQPSPGDWTSVVRAACAALTAADPLA